MMVGLGDLPYVRDSGQFRSDVCTEFNVLLSFAGDPTVFGNLPPNERCVEAFCDKIKSGEDNGYHLAHGRV